MNYSTTCQSTRISTDKVLRCLFYLAMQTIFVQSVYGAEIGISDLTGYPRVIDLIGDIDGFGIGVGDGESFNYMEIGIGDGDGTDEWIFRRTGAPYLYKHSYMLPDSPIVAATLEIFHGGLMKAFASDGAELTLDGVQIGLLRAGDAGVIGENTAFIDTFDLTPYRHLLQGTNTIGIESRYLDGWAFDYSLLTLYVPEPTVFVQAMIFDALYRISSAANPQLRAKRDV